VSRALRAPSASRSFYGDRIPAQVLAERLASFIHLYTLYWSVRPFGASVLLAVADGTPGGGAALYMLDPAGEVHRYHGAAIGKGRTQAKTEIERLKLGELTCAEAVTEVAKIIHRCHDEKDKAFECELSWVCAASGWQHARVPAAQAAQAVADAKAALEAAGMED
jgi:20S proteasome subunit alpha 7